MYIKTDQIDGETDLKVREAVKTIQEMVGDDPRKILDCKGYIQADPPCKDVHKFNGEYFNDHKEEEPLSLKNTIWANTTVVTNEVYGLVIYVGKETRIKMNAKDPRTKFGKTDHELDRLSQYLFIGMVAMALTLFILSGSWRVDNWYIKLIKYLVLLSSIIPISLRVNLDFAKLVYSIRVNYDKRLEGTVVRNTAIPEELGRVEYLLSDKTGTLTKNEMVFKQLTTEFFNFTNENVNMLKELLTKEAEAADSIGENCNNDEKKNKRAQVRESITSLMLCNNIISFKIQGER